MSYLHAELPPSFHASFRQRKKICWAICGSELNFDLSDFIHKRCARTLVFCRAKEPALLENPLERFSQNAVEITRRDFPSSFFIGGVQSSIL